MMLVLRIFEFGYQKLITCLKLFAELHAKMSSFSITRKKTPFQKHREEEEAKKKVGVFINWVIFGI